MKSKWKKKDHILPMPSSKGYTLPFQSAWKEPYGTKNKLDKLQSEVFFSSPNLFSVFYEIFFFLLGWLHSLLAVILNMYPKTLASLISWIFPANPSFNFKTSYNGLSIRPLFINTTNTCLASVALFHSSFFLFLTLKLEPCGQSCQFLWFAGAVT